MQAQVLLWEDLPCVNQKHGKEQDAQVSTIGKVYREALLVVEWLEWPQICAGPVLSISPHCQYLGSRGRNTFGNGFCQEGKIFQGT